MKVAFATGSCEHVDEQFRRSSNLVVYELTASGFELDAVYAFPPGDAAGTDDRIRAILGAALVFAAAMGPSVAARLARHGIRPATAPPGSRIQDLLARLWQTLATGALARPRPGARGADGGALLAG